MLVFKSFDNPAHVVKRFQYSTEMICKTVEHVVVASKGSRRQFAGEQKERFQ